MSGKFKTRKVTEMGRLVTRAELHTKIQSAANQIGAHVLGGLQKLEDAHDARMADIELRLRLLEVTAGYAFLYEGDTGRRTTHVMPKVERKLELVEADCSAPQAEIEALNTQLDQPKEIA